MYSSGKKFDENAIIQACSTQESASHQSHLQKREDVTLYDDALNAHRNAKVALIKRRQYHQELVFKLKEKINLKNSIDKSMTSRLNQESKMLQNEVLKIYNSRAKKTDDYDASVQQIVGEIKDLAKLFETALLEKKIEENKKMLKELENTLKNSEINYGISKKMVDTMSTPEEFKTSNVDKILKDFAALNIDLQRSIRENEKIMILVKKNVDFLTEENSKLKLQMNLSQ